MNPKGNEQRRQSVLTLRDPSNIYMLIFTAVTDFVTRSSAQAEAHTAVHTDSTRVKRTAAITHTNTHGRWEHSSQVGAGLLSYNIRGELSLREEGRNVSKQCFSLNIIFIRSDSTVAEGRSRKSC